MLTVYCIILLIIFNKGTSNFIMNLVLIISLIIVGIGSGIMGSAVGIASLVSYPALIALGLSPVAANVTGTFANIFTGFGSIPASAKELHGHWQFITKVLPLILSGCIVGALLLFAFPEKTFAKVVPFFILMAAGLVLIPSVGKRNGHSKLTITFLWIAIFFAGIYSGYFGAACGVIMLAIFNIITDDDYITYNAEKNVMMPLANLTSLIIYMLNTTIRWAWVIPLSIGFIIGGYIGPSIVRHIPDKIIKILVAVCSVILAGSLAYRAYR